MSAAKPSIEFLNEQKRVIENLLREARAAANHQAMVLATFGLRDIEAEIEYFYPMKPAAVPMANMRDLDRVMGW